MEKGIAVLVIFCLTSSKNQLFRMLLDIVTVGWSMKDPRAVIPSKCFPCGGHGTRVTLKTSRVKWEWHGTDCCLLFLHSFRFHLLCTQALIARSVVGNQDLSLSKWYFFFYFEGFSVATHICSVNIHFTTILKCSIFSIYLSAIK